MLHEAIDLAGFRLQVLTHFPGLWFQDAVLICENLQSQKLKQREAKKWTLGTYECFCYSNLSHSLKQYPSPKSTAAPFVQGKERRKAFPWSLNKGTQR
ncbi:uncharacterized protein LOC143685172 isoform X2 [Tamandua tetradactyla]|uniref:uncharacterized protein LOC143685172 isoform X2 n=1 Tax=Tamandua tetradactyla TaxID=48850 RepID=UPI004053ECA6